MHQPLVGAEAVSIWGQREASAGGSGSDWWDCDAGQRSLESNLKPLGSHCGALEREMTSIEFACSGQDLVGQREQVAKAWALVAAERRKPDGDALENKSTCFVN